MIDDLERAASALLHLDPTCSREDWVRAAMAAHSAGLGFDDFHAWSANGGNYKSEADCTAVWRSFKANRGISAASLFQMAFMQGWQDPAKRLQAVNWPRVGTAMPAPKKAPVTPIKREASGKAAEVWSRCKPAPHVHPYIARKGGLPDGLGVYPGSAPPLVIRGQNVAGFLVVPCWSKGKLQTLQFIPDRGPKLNLSGASFNDGYFAAGDIANSARVFIAEGVGQAWAINASTNDAVVVSFGAGRMKTVAEAVRGAHPAARVVIVPDRGKESQAEAIARALNCEWVKLPAGKPDNYDANDFALEFGPDPLSELLDQAIAPAKPEPRFKLLNGADLHAMPHLQWRLRGVLPALGLCALYGPSASGKSFLALDMAAAIAEGCDWFGCRAQAAPVVYAALEGEAGFRLRVAAWEAYNGHKLPDGLRMVLQPFKLTDANDVLDLAAVIPTGAVIFIDTLNRAAPTADENNSRDMGDILEAVKQLQTLTGGLVVLVHHTGKDSTKGLRGHSSLFAALDAAVEVSRDGDRREWRVAKSKDGQDGDSHPFKLQIEALGVDEHGDPVTSCVVVPDTAVESIRRVRMPTGGNQRLVVEALRPLLKAGTTGKAGAPPTRPCIDLEAAVTVGAASLTCPTDKRTSRSREAITGLITRGYLGCNEGWLWAV